MYSISPGLYTCTVYHLVYIHVHDITKTFETWKLVYTNYILQYTLYMYNYKNEGVILILILTT